jgi:hypothetical protein
VPQNDRPNRLETHQAIEIAMQTEDDDECRRALQTIIRYAQPISASKSSLVIIRNTKEKNSFTGHTSECGDVQITDPSPIKTREWRFGGDKDRVGHYRLWKPREGSLRFHHFWASDATTLRRIGGKASVYTILYDAKTLEPTCLGVHEPYRMREFKFFSLRLGLYVLRVSPLWGQIPRDYYPFETTFYMFKIR